MGDTKPVRSCHQSLNLKQREARAIDEFNIGIKLDTLYDATLDSVLSKPALNRIIIQVGHRDTQFLHPCNSDACAHVAKSKSASTAIILRSIVTLRIVISVMYHGLRLEQ